MLDVLAAPFSWPSKTPPGVWLPVPLAVSPFWAWMLALGLSAWLLLPIRRRFALLGLAGIGACALAWPAPGQADLELAMLDVGQGDAILLRDGNRAILVDGGGWRGGDIGGRALLPALLGEGVRSLDALVMTHPDGDVCGGFSPA